MWSKNRPLELFRVRFSEPSLLQSPRNLLLQVLSCLFRFRHSDYEIKAGDRTRRFPFPSSLLLSAFLFAYPFPFPPCSHFKLPPEIFQLGSQKGKKTHIRFLKDFPVWQLSSFVYWLRELMMNWECSGHGVVKDLFLIFLIWCAAEKRGEVIVFSSVLDCVFLLVFWRSRFEEGFGYDPNKKKALDDGYSRWR